MTPSRPPETTSISTQTWMHDMSIQQPGFDDRPLRELVIPGSHDAGTFAMQIVTDNLSSQCQDISILEQLKAGSRYLDLRAWKAMDGLYWIYHGAVWTKVKLEDVTQGHQDLPR